MRFSPDMARTDARSEPVTGPARVRGRRWSASVASVVVLASIVGGRPLVARAGSADAQTVAPGTRIALFGSYVKPRPKDPVVTGDPGRDAVLRMEADIGRRLAMDHVYYHFDDPWPERRQRWDVRKGRVPLISWQPEEPVVTWSEIADGAADDIIDQRARDAAAFDARIFLSFHHEPENDASTYGEPKDFIAAWRHIVERFRDAGADKVRFVLTLEAFSYTSSEADRWYPGTDVVDVVAADGYNWFGTRSSATWREVSDIFGPFYDWSVAAEEPAFITEAGTLEDPDDGQRKAGWFERAGAWLRDRPNIRAFVYFSSDRRWPWWADSSKASLAAFADLANSSPFVPRRPDSPGGGEPRDRGADGSN